MLTLSLSLILGSLKYDSHVIKMEVYLGLLPHVNRVEVSLPINVQISASVGDDASLDMLSDGNITRVLTGKIAAIQTRLQQHFIILSDGAYELAHTRTAASYTEQDTAAIINHLAKDAGVSSQLIEADLPLASFIAHQNSTTAEHITQLAELSNCIALVSADGKLNVIKRPSSQADSALLYGREFIHYQATEHQPPRDKIVLTGNGTAGNISAAGALRHSSTALPASAPAADNQHRHVPQALLKTASSSVSAAQAINTQRAASSMELQAECWLLPELSPGQVIQVQGLNDTTPAGPWLLTAVTHALDAQGSGKTKINAELADTTALTNSLSSAMNTIGAML